MSGLAIAILAGGCFWCLQGLYDVEPGVVSTQVGYIGGQVENPTYEQVSTGTTGHYEAIKIEYDPKKVSSERLMEIFWRNIDPTQANGQFNDIGPQYRTAIFVASDEERKKAEASREQLGQTGKFKKPIVTEILPQTKFYPAEDYHEKYYQKNPTHYNLYKEGSGRGPFIKKQWDGK